MKQIFLTNIRIYFHYVLQKMYLFYASRTKLLFLWHIFNINAEKTTMQCHPSVPYPPTTFLKMVIYVGYSLERLVSLSNFDMFHPAIEDTLSNKAL